MTKGVSTTEPNAALKRSLVAVQRARRDIGGVVTTLRDGRLTAPRQQLIDSARKLRTFIADFEEQIKLEIER